MSNNQAMRDQLLALLRGGHAHLTFDQAVANFPPERINSRPPNVPYTPWHLLEHLRIAQWDILEFIRNPDHVSPEWPAGYWPDPAADTDEAGWQGTIAAFQADLGALEALVTDPATDLLGELMELSQQAFGSPELMEALGALDGNLRALRPGEDWSGSQSFSGDEGLGLGDGTGVLQDVAELESLSACLRTGFEDKLRPPISHDHPSYIVFFTVDVG